MRLAYSDQFQGIYTCCNKSFSDTLMSVSRFDDKMLKIPSTTVMPTHHTPHNTLIDRSHEAQPRIALEVSSGCIPGICFSDGNAGSRAEHCDDIIVVIDGHFTYVHINFYPLPATLSTRSPPHPAQPSFFPAPLCGLYRLRRGECRGLRRGGRDSRHGVRGLRRRCPR